MEWVKSQWDGFIKDIRSMNKRQLMGQGVNLGALGSCLALFHAQAQQRRDSTVAHDCRAGSHFSTDNLEVVDPHYWQRLPSKQLQASAC